MTVKRIYILILVITFFATPYARAQQVIMQESYDKSELNSAWGPNERNYIHISVGFNTVFGPHGTGMDVNNKGSNSFPILIRYKYKLGGLIALGAETGIRSSNYDISPQSTARFPDSLFKGLAQVHKSADFGFYEIPLGLFIRVNLDPHRGNTTGKYIDLGGQVLYNIGSNYTVTDKLPDDEKRETEYSALPYINNFREEVYARVGSTFFALVFHYSLTDQFKSSYNFPTFPRFSAGVEINLAK